MQTSGWIAVRNCSDQRLLVYSPKKVLDQSIVVMTKQ